jgi:hypothetical protein
MATTAFHFGRFMGSAMLLGSALLSACGGGSSSAPVATTLSGTAAVGLPIVGGTIAVNCATGSPLSATTSSTGGWTVTINGQTLPCATRVTGGTVSGVANTTPYHSIAVSFGTVNITPLTDLVVAQLSGADPAVWFGSPVFTGVNAAALNTALSTVSTNLGLASTLGETNPLTTSFAPQNGVLLDDVLEALKTTLADASVNKSYAELLAAAAAGNFSTFSGFQTAFSTIYVNLAPATPSGATTCASGETLMVYDGGSSKYTKGQGVCFTGSATALTFSGKTLSNPVANSTATNGNFVVNTFTDASDSYAYEVVLNSGALYEINVSNPNYVGQFAPSTGSTASAGGAGSLTVVTSVAGIATPAIVVSPVTKPANQSDFCSGITSDSSLTSLTAAGGSLTIDSCTFSGSVGTIAATLRSVVTLSYSITYTYN